MISICTTGSTVQAKARKCKTRSESKCM